MVATLLLSLGVMVAGVLGLRGIPSGAVSLMLLLPLAVAGHAAAVEWRTSNVAAFAPVHGWLMAGVAFLIGLPAAWFSLLMESTANVPPGCPGPLPVPDGVDAEIFVRCEQMTPAETAGLVAWAAVVGLTAILLLGGIAMAKRSETVGWVAVPLAIAGCLIAFDVGHLTFSIWS